MIGNTDILDKICALRARFDDIISSHSDDEGFTDSVLSALGNNEFPDAEKIRADFEKDTSADRLLKIGIVGAVKAGKSSLLNALFFNGKDILPKAARPMTAALTELKYGEKITVTVDFFTDDDIKRLCSRFEQYNNELKKRIGEILEEQQKNYQSKGIVLPLSTLEEKAKTQAKRELQGNIFLAGAAQQYEDIKNARKKPNSKRMEIQADSIDSIADKLEDFVGSTGDYTPFTSKVSLTLPLEQLKDISIVDTPGFNDPVPSREERARTSLHECDVVLILSPARQFLSASDNEVLTKITTKNGIRELYIIQSQVDSQLFNPEIVDEADGNLGEAINLIVSQLNSVTKRNLKTINDDNVFDELITNTESRSFPTSGICQSMADSFSQRASWDAGRKKVWDNLSRNYPDYFSDKDENTSITFLNKLGNIDKIKDCLDSVKARKQQIFAEKLAAFEKKHIERAEATKKEILEYITQREQTVQRNDIKKLEQEINALSTSYAKLAPELKESYIDAVYEWCDEVRDNYETIISSADEDAKKGLNASEGTDTRHWTTGILWWKKYHSEEYKTANLAEIKNSIVDFINSYNYDIPYYMDKQIYRLTKKVLVAVQKTWSDNLPMAADSLIEVRNKARAVMEKMHFNYNLEYSGPSFEFNSYSNRLTDSAAEECIASAKRFERDLFSAFRGNLKNTIDDILVKCKASNFADLVLDGFIKQLEKKKNDLEKPKLALETLKRMKREIASL